jgi:CHAT domain-containing protein
VTRSAWRSLLAGAVLVIAGVGGPRSSAGQPDPISARTLELQQKVWKLQGEGKYFAARRQAMKVVQFLDNKRGAGHRETLQARQTAASLFTVTGDYVTAERLYLQVVRQTERQVGPSDIQLAHVLDGLAGVYWGQQRLDEVEKLYARSLAIYRKHHGAESEMFAHRLLTQAAFLQARYMFAAAEQQYREAQRIYRKHDPKSPSALSVDLSIGMLYGRQGDYKRARGAFNRMIRGYEKVYGKNDTDHLPSMLQTAASLYALWGLEKEAKGLHARAVKLTETKITALEGSQPDSPMIAVHKLQLASMLQRSGEIDRAIDAYVELLASYEKQHGKGSFQTVGALFPLADLYKQKRDFNRARQLLRRVEKSYSRMFGGFSATTPLILLSEVEREAGRWAEARQLTVKVLAAAAKTYGKNHPFAAQYRERMAILDLALGKAKRALGLLEDSYAAEKKNIALILASGTEDDNRTYLSERRHHLHVAVTLHARYLPRDQRAIRLGFDTALTRKGRLLDASAASVGTLRKGLSKSDQKLLAELSAARSELAKLVVAGPKATGDDEAEYARELARLEAKVRQLETKVRGRSAVFRAKEQPIEVAKVRKAIPADAALLEIVSYKPIDPKSTGYLPKSGDRYGAYLVRRRGPIIFVDLGPSARIDKLVDAFRSELSSAGGTDYKDLGQRLYNLVLKKLAPALGKTKHVLLAPDGALNLLPFAALIDGSGKFAVERFRFTYLTSGRDLLRLAVKIKPKGGSVIFADPAFDGGAGGKPDDKTRGRRSRSLRSMKWSKLPGTAEEAVAIAKLLARASLFRGHKATESALKKVTAPKILHLATHGFFLPPDDTDVSVEITAGGQAPPTAPPGAMSAPPVADGQENPLLRSGLVLAGANKLTSGVEDGVLTALEAAGLDLWGTELVVMSACETGVGKIAQGEGVYGLRRALVIAGAESMLMSLWQVDDAATRDLMTGYYRRLKQKKGRSEALRLTQIKMLRSSDYSHPYYWASFIPSGDWTPMQ